MKTSDFDFDLPTTAIAQHPAEPRDAARLLHVGPALRDLRVLDLPSLLSPDDVLIVNDTRVVPTRLRGTKGDAEIEVTLHKHLPGGGAHDLWLAFARPAKKLKPGDDVRFADALTATVEAKGLGGEITLSFPLAHADLLAALNRVGIMPLPPYIKRPAGGDARDAEDYQTRFAARDGAVAAPTAGLHFTDRLIAAVAARDVAIHRLTLHVGAGTFLPVKTEDPAEHKMHAEWGEVTAATADAVNAAKAKGGRVVAVGTTALRLLESAAAADGKLKPFVGETDIFILPGYRFKIVDRLMTNFHLPKSTLFMLVSAFAGLERMKAAYAHALKTGYRFYSYGDACLLERQA